MKEMTASEALYGFGAWLTTRDESVTFGANNDCAPMADLIGRFCKANKLAETTEAYPNCFVMPKEGDGI